MSSNVVRFELGLRKVSLAVSLRRASIRTLVESLSSDSVQLGVRHASVLHALVTTCQVSRELAVTVDEASMSDDHCHHL